MSSLKAAKRAISLNLDTKRTAIKEPIERKKIFRYPERRWRHKIGII
jgi:hypothetical protein